LKLAVYTEDPVDLKQGDLFGNEKSRTPRGWTELDRIRKRFDQLERKIKSGDYKDKDLEQLEKLRLLRDKREQEAREAWAKSFKA
jgi:DNA-binding PadR family transcriptional regulator